jgi:flagellar hook-basal body complex protein FliE
MYDNFTNPLNAANIASVTTPVQPNTTAAPNKPGAARFDEMLGNFLTDVNHMQKNADTSIQKMVTGDVKDVHQVMLAVGEAKVAFNLMLEIRNKTLDAYNELVKMRG